MKPSISPLELRKRTFAKRLRGYDRNEVNQFLESMAEDMEGIWRRMDELERENVRLQEDASRHSESETTLRDTLLLAQKSADGLREAAGKEAELVVAEAERQADRLVAQSMDRASEIEKRIRDLRMERKNFHLKLQGMLELFQQVLVFDKEDDDHSATVSVMRTKGEKKREGESA